MKEIQRNRIQFSPLKTWPPPDRVRHLSWGPSAIDTLPTWINSPPLSLYLFIYFQAGRTLAWFSLLVFRCGSGCQIKAQAAARVGRSGTSAGCLTAPEEGAGRTPQLLSKGNIVLIRNRKRASLLCACTAVLIYLDLK